MKINQKFKLYNSLTRTKEVFESKSEGEVKIYSCGVTVYDYCHIGHGMQAYTMGVLTHFLKQIGYQVSHIRNYTDVDDKIIQRAEERGLKPLELSELMIQKTREDFSSMGIAGHFTAVKVSENMPQIIEMIETLVEKGHAYSTNDGNVYFDVTTKKDYGKLSGQRLAEHQSGARQIKSGEKRNEQDFVLWKPETVEGAVWSSPWGVGRPGWHIECSALAKRYLGDSIDIHCGGLDLIFPHHENEIAQSECANGCEFSRYWVHNGLLTIEKQKMSKSIGNFITIQDAIKKYHPEVIKLTFCQNHYRSNLDLSDHIFIQSLKRLLYFYQSLEQWAGFVELHESLDLLQSQVVGLHPKGPELVKCVNEVLDAMLDDLNSPKAVAALHQCFKMINQIASGKKPAPVRQLIHWAWLQMSPWFEVFGVLQHKPEEMIVSLNSQGIVALGLSQSQIDQLVSARQAARQSKNWAESDRLRDQLKEMGVAVLDRGEQSTWTLA